MKFVKRVKEICEGVKIVEYVSNELKLSASRTGISIAGESQVISNQEDLEILAEYIARAWQHHQALKGCENGLSVESDS
jgi:hypothetical protein